VPLDRRTGFTLVPLGGLNSCLSQAKEERNMKPVKKLFAGLLVSVLTIAFTSTGYPAADPADLNPMEEANSPARVMKIGDQTVKVFDAWGASEVKRGDCRARNPKLTVYQNGSIEWEVEMRSKDAGDEWMHAFEFLGGGSVLGSRPVVRYTIMQGNKWLTWHSGGASAPDSKLAGVFDRIQTVRWSSAC
jgi:hypothetical protein